MALSAKQQAFVEHYLQCWNASEAARLAGYAEKTAPAQGSRLLKNVNVQARVQERLNELKMEADEVLLRLADQARATMEDFIDPARDEVDLLRAAERGKLHLIKKFSKTTGKVENVTIELHDAQSALVQLGRAHGLFTDKQDVSGRIEVEYVNDWRVSGHGDD